MTDRLDAMTVRVENEGGVVGGMVLRAEFRRPIIPASSIECGYVEGIDGRAVRGSETEVRARRRRDPTLLCRDRELHAERARPRALIRA